MTTTDSKLNHRMAEAFKHVSSELLGESDRGAVILAFAWMDEGLTRALKKFFLPSTHRSEKGDELFGVGRPLGDAATKIDVAYRLGLIRESTYKSLHIIRRLRNDFAHLSSKLSFETDNVRDRVNTLFDLQSDMTDAFLEITKEIPEVGQLLQGHAGKPSARVLPAALGSKALFALLSGTIVSGLMLLTNEVAPVSHQAASTQ